MKISCNILNPTFFLKHMKCIAEFCDEGYIHFNNGIRFIGIDPSRIAVMELLMANDVVETNSNNKLSAPVNLWDLSKIIARFSKPEELELAYDEIDNRVMVRGDIVGKKKTFRLSTIDINENLEDPLPALAKIKYNAIFKINSKSLLDAVKDTELFAESVRFSTEGSELIVSTYGCIGDVETRLETGSEIYGSEKTRYSINYLKKILIPMGDSNILLMFKSDFPVAIYDKLSEKSHMLYYLAPIVEEPDGELDE